MPLPVTKSSTPLVQDTLPALKAIYYNGNDENGHIYTFCRLYFLNNALAVNLCCFQRTPPAGSRAAFALAKNAHCLLLTLPPQQAGAPTLFAGDAQAFNGPVPPFGQPLAAPGAQYFSGQDEQGWYWGANFELGAGILEQIGLQATVNNTFYAAVFQYNTQKTGLVSSAAFTPEGTTPVNRFNQFEIVSY